MSNASPKIKAAWYATAEGGFWIPMHPSKIQPVYDALRKLSRSLIDPCTVEGISLHAAYFEFDDTVFRWDCANGWIDDPYRSIVLSVPRPSQPQEQQELAMRFNEGKPQLSYLFDFQYAVDAFADVCTAGAKKYSRDNWKKGRKYRDTVDSLLRHVAAFQSGQDDDPETGCKHMAHAMWNCAALLEFGVTHPELDDRAERQQTETNQKEIAE